MHNVLVFCRRDWLHPDAGPMEYYVHQVFSRIAARGSFVSCLAQRHPFFPRPRRPQTELTDGVQVARLGYGFFYRRMASMFLTTLAQKRHQRLRFQTILDCVTNSPLDLADVARVPVVPLVFDLDKRLRCVELVAGPVLAATPRARRKLLEAGIPAKYVISAYFGAGAVAEPGETARGSERVLAVAGHLPRFMRRALRILRKAGCPYRVVACDPVRAPEEARRVFQEAWAGYCGAGCEFFAPEMAACGLPVLCAGPGQEGDCVVDGETGFVLTGDAHAAVDCLMRLARDGALRDGMAAACRDYARAHSWEATSGLVLAVIENLQRELDLGAPPESMPREEVPV